ncbi:MAG: hypothetical protein HY296_02600 [Thaumarchaeota archaeon]|nr:hypothetical protein [Nitrososphaerota archaeon]
MAEGESLLWATYPAIGPPWESMEKELLFEAKVNTSSINIREFSPQGARIDVLATGKVSGKVSGLIFTTHNALLKADGTGEADIRYIVFSNGEPVFVWGKAAGKAVDPTPTYRIEENLTFQTPSQKLGYLNTTKGWLEGLYNFASGEYNFKVYATK